MVKRRYDRLSTGVDLDDQLGHIQKQTKSRKQEDDTIMVDLRKAYPSMDDSELHKMLEWGKDEGLELLSSIGKLMGVAVGGAATAGIGYMLGLATSNPAATAALLFLAGGKVYSGVVKAEVAIQNLGSKIYTGLFRAGLSRETGFADSFAKFWRKNMKINKYTAAEAYQSTGGVELKGGLTRNDYMKGHELHDPGSVINRVKRIYRRFKETTEERMSREMSEADSDQVAARYDEILTESFEQSNNSAEARVARTLAGNPIEDLQPDDIEFIRAVEKKWKRPISEIDDSVIDSRSRPDKDPGKHIHEDFKGGGETPDPIPPEQAPVSELPDVPPEWDESTFDPGAEYPDVPPEDYSAPTDPVSEPVVEPVGPPLEPGGPPLEPVGPADASGLSDFIDRYIKFKNYKAQIPSSESINIPELSQKIGVDPALLTSVVEEGGVEGQSVLAFLSEVGSHINLMLGPAFAAMFVYSVYSGVEGWKKMDKTRAALASTLSQAKPGDPGYYDMRTALKHMDETDAIQKSLTVGNWVAGGAGLVSSGIITAGATGLITIGPELAMAASALGVVGLALGAVVTVAALALIVGPAVAQASRDFDDNLEWRSNHPANAWGADTRKTYGDLQSRMVALLNANPMTARMGHVYAKMSVEKFIQQYSPKWELMAPIFASIYNHPESWGYKDALAAQTDLEEQLDETGRRTQIWGSEEGRQMYDPNWQGAGSNANRWGNFLVASQRKHLDMMNKKPMSEQTFSGIKDMRNPAYAKWYDEHYTNNPDMHYVHGKWVHVDPVILGGAKNKDEINRINGHHKLAEKYAPSGNNTGDRGHGMSWSHISTGGDLTRAEQGWSIGVNDEHPSITRDIPFDTPVDTSTGRYAKDGQGAGVKEVGKNYDKAHAAGQKGTDLSLSLHKPDVKSGAFWDRESQINRQRFANMDPASYRRESQINRQRFTNWTTNNPNNHVVESHGNAEANRIWTTPSSAAPKGINQPANPKPHHGESIIGGATETDKPGTGLFTSHDPDLPYGSFPVHHWGNATEAPADDPSHMVEPGGSQNPFRGSNPPTHSGARSGVTLGDLRVLHALNRSVLNQEPMAIAAKKNFMHSLGERAAFD